MGRGRDGLLALIIQRRAEGVEGHSLAASGQEAHHGLQEAAQLRIQALQADRLGSELTLASTCKQMQAARWK